MPFGLHYATSANEAEYLKIVYACWLAEYCALRSPISVCCFLCSELTTSPSTPACMVMGRTHPCIVQDKQWVVRFQNFCKLEEFMMLNSFSWLSGCWSCTQSIQVVRKGRAQSREVRRNFYVELTWETLHPFTVLFHSWKSNFVENANTWWDSVHFVIEHRAWINTVRAVD